MRAAGHQARNRTYDSFVVSVSNLLKLEAILINTFSITWPTNFNLFVAKLCREFQSDEDL